MEPDKGSSFDLVVFGQVTHDRLHFDEGSMSRIGGTTYASSVASKLGLKSCIISYLGSEQLPEATTSLQNRSISTLWMEIEGPSISYEIWDADEVVSQTAVRSGPAIPMELSLPSAADNLACRAALIYPVAIPTSMELISILRSKGAFIAVDLQHDIKRIEEFAELAPKVDLIFSNAGSLMSLFNAGSLDDAIQCVFSVSPQAHLVLKMGLAGSLVICPSGQRNQIPAYVADFKCTVGAGDAFDAAFLHRILEGSDYFEAARFAAKVAATVVESVDDNPADAISDPLAERTPVGNAYDKPKPLIYIAGHFHSNPLRQYIERIAGALEKIGFLTYVPHRDGGVIGSNGVTGISAFNADVIALKNCDGIVAILDGAYRGGTYFELGYAYALSIPLFVIRTDGTLGVSNMVMQSARLITSDVRQLVNEVIQTCGSLRT